jgi:excisionase family DNA binding protein
MEDSLLSAPREQHRSDPAEMQEAEVPVGSPILTALDRRRSIGATEAALLIGVSMRTLRRYAEAGLVPGAYRVGPGCHWRYKRRELAQWWESLEGQEWSRGQPQGRRRGRSRKGGEQ